MGGTATGIGELPHLDADHAAMFALHSLELPCIPRLPRRSPAEGGIAQAMVGLCGITIGQYGSVAVHASDIDPSAPLFTRLDDDPFVGFRTFLDAAPRELGREYEGWVSWQFVGPVTLGLALLRAGVGVQEAFDTAARAVSARLQHLLGAVAASLPRCRQMVFVEEPGFRKLNESWFPIAPETAIDLVSGALATVEAAALAGLHCCAADDIHSQLATGPAVLSLPVSSEVADSAGHLANFLDVGGLIAWGVVSTTGPIATSVERPWRQLCTLWCELVQRGVDPVRLRTQAMVTPQCGLSSHSPAVAKRVHALVAEVGNRVRDQAQASRWVLGA